MLRAQKRRKKRKRTRHVRVSACRDVMRAFKSPGVWDRGRGREGEGEWEGKKREREREREREGGREGVSGRGEEGG